MEQCLPTQISAAAPSANSAVIWDVYGDLILHCFKKLYWHCESLNKDIIFVKSCDIRTKLERCYLYEIPSSNISQGYYKLDALQSNTAIVVMPHCLHESYITIFE